MSVIVVNIESLCFLTSLSAFRIFTLTIVAQFSGFFNRFFAETEKNVHKRTKTAKQFYRSLCKVRWIYERNE